MIVILATDCDATRAIFHALRKYTSDIKVVIETPISKLSLIKIRYRRFGLAHVFGQLLFQTLISPLLKILSQARIQEIKNESQLNFEEIPLEHKVNVSSVNSSETIALIKQLNPKVIVLSGTRIVSNALIKSVNCALINMHAGITPLYRGVHGGYWALADGRPELAGVTVHYVDAGIDTGKVINQAVIRPKSTDNFSTYPYVQLATGIPILIRAIETLQRGESPSKTPLTRESSLRSHPTIWSYLWNYLKNRVK